MNKGNVAVCPRKFEGAKFLCSVFRLEKDHSKNSLASSGESREHITTTATLMTIHPSPLSCWWNILFSED
jgi:hypothetical protein